MVFSSLAPRLSTAVLLTALLSACSGSERVPLADIGAPGTGGVLVGRVDPKAGDRQLLGRVGAPAAEAVAYAPASTGDNQGEAGIDYINTPNLAEPASSEPSAQAMLIPPGGVNIDGELGIGSDAMATGPAATTPSPAGVQPQIVTAHGAMAMAEGYTDQPVVDGIGFDNPAPIVTGPVSPVSATEPTELAEQDAILPLAVDNGNSGLEDQPQPPARAAPQAMDCALYLDKRNCRLR